MRKLKIIREATAAVSTGPDVVDVDLICEQVPLADYLLADATAVVLLEPHPTPGGFGLVPEPTLRFRLPSLSGHSRCHSQHKSDYLVC